MQSGGKSYEVTGETTEWEDILIKKGITTKEDVLIGKGLNPEDVSLIYLFAYSNENCIIYENSSKKRSKNLLNLIKKPLKIFG